MPNAMQFTVCTQMEAQPCENRALAEIRAKYVGWNHGCHNLTYLGRSQGKKGGSKMRQGTMVGRWRWYLGQVSKGASRQKGWG